MKRNIPVALLFGWLALSVGPSIVAQTVAGGPAATIEGRVLNTSNNEYVERARVTVEGTSLETFTDSAGQFRLVNVPAGAAKVTVFFTGLELQGATVHLAAGETVRRDFKLSPAQKGGEVDKSGIVRLSEFVVGARREMDGAAIAINEQRFASNMKNVVTVEEFGTVAEGNVAEVLKFLPGVTIDYGAGDASTVSIGGAPSAYVPVTVGGFALATAASSGTSRSVQFEQFSINNIARIEVLHSPTPESAGSALAGSVNLVTRSAFERSKPVLNYSAYFMMRDAEKSLRKTPGPFDKHTYKIRPGFDFSYIRPINERLGVTLSAGHNSQYGPQDFISPLWVGAAAPTNPAGGLPDTTPDKPYMTQLTVKDGTKLITRSNIGTTVDYKLSRDNRVSLSFLFAEFENEFRNRQQVYQVNRVSPGNFSPSFTHGDPGVGEVRYSNGANRKFTKSYMPTLSFRHDGPIWKADAGAGYSHALNQYTDTQDGFMKGVGSRRTGVTVWFDDIFYLRPRTITVRDGATGALVDPDKITTYAFNTATSTNRLSTDGLRSAFANLTREFDVRGLPLAMKAGLDFTEQTRDIRTQDRAFTFVGADGRATTTPTDPLGSDDSAAIIRDESFVGRYLPYGFGRPEWTSYEKAYQLFVDRPDYFLGNANNDYRSAVNGSKFAREAVSSAYLRGDLSLLNRRLKFVGGLRGEQTNVKAEGPLTDITRNYQRDASGRVILANGNPVLIVPTTDALGVSQRTLLDRGQKTNKEYLRLFPSLNASYNVRENFIARAAYYQSIGRPDFNQYAGGLTLPDTERAPAQNNRIAVNNAGVKAWTARTFKVRLEYYMQPVGQFTVSAFRRDYENFFGTVATQATPEFLQHFGLDAATYGAYEVQTQFNLPSTLRTTGMDFDYKQVLTFLPHWARGVQVFANASTTRVIGPASANFLGYIPRSGSLGASLTREKFNLRVNWNFRSRARRAEITGRGIEPGTFEYRNSRSLMDLQGDYNLTPRFALFFNMRNVGDVPEDVERLGPSTPEVAQFRQRENWGALWTFGVKGSF